jgi:hypothetical protein
LSDFDLNNIGSDISLEAFKGFVWISWSIFCLAIFSFASYDYENRKLTVSVRYLALSYFVFFPIYFVIVMIGEKGPFELREIFSLHFIFLLIPPNCFFMYSIITHLFVSEGGNLKEKILAKIESLPKDSKISIIISKLKFIREIIKKMTLDRERLFYFIVTMIISISVLFAYSGDREKFRTDKSIVEFLFHDIFGMEKREKKQKDFFEEDKMKKDESEYESFNDRIE